MNYKHILLCALIVPVTFTSYGQEPNVQRIKELEDAWYEKAEELAALGKKLIEKNELIANLKENSVQLFRKAGFGHIWSDNTVPRIALENFIKKLLHTVHDKVDIKGFLLHELLDNKETYLKNGEAKPGFLDSIKLNALQTIIEVDLAVKLLEDYEKCLQKMAEIDHELASLGHSRLYR